MRVITAPQELKLEVNEFSIFLAGGIQKTEDWQKRVIQALSERFAGAPLVVMNPRRDNFPIHDPNAAYEQIKWEYDMLDQADIFSMYFAEGDTDQPICMYEYGKHLERHATRNDFKTLVVSAEPKYRRYQDVMIQTSLVNPAIKVGQSLEEHVAKIIACIEEFLLNNHNFYQ